MYIDKPIKPIELKDQIKNWMFESHFWVIIEVNGIELTKCKWCGEFMPNNSEGITLCKQNPEILKL